MRQLLAIFTAKMTLEGALSPMKWRFRHILAGDVIEVSRRAPRNESEVMEL
jgi:hypothetical protein